MSVEREKALVAVVIEALPSVKPLRMKARLYNNRIVSLREARGFKSASAAALEMGMGVSEYCGYEALSRSPMMSGNKNARGTTPARVAAGVAAGDAPLVAWKLSAMRIAEFYRVTEEYLWPDIARAVTKNSVQMELDAAEAVAMLTPPVSGADDRLCLQESGVNAAKLMGMLLPIERQVLRRRFGFDGDDEKTLKEVGANWGLSRERTRQLQEQALQKLRRLLESDEEVQTASPGFRLLKPPCEHAKKTGRG